MSYPESIDQVLVVLEITYGDRLHEDRATCQLAHGEAQANKNGGAMLEGKLLIWRQRLILS